MADGPGRVGGKPEPSPGIKPGDGSNQAGVPLLDEVEERQAATFVTLGDRDHQTQVRFHEPTGGLFCLNDHLPQLPTTKLGHFQAAVQLVPGQLASLDDAAQLALFGGGQERVPPYLGEIQVQQLAVR